jgi:tRNA G10  N-methylase Trm11
MGTYSPSVYPDKPILAVNDLFSSIQFAVADVSVLAPGRYDAIVTDPPYGFNTDEDYWALAKFVRTMVPKLIESLKPQGGQLLLAAPQASFSGRVVIPFVRSLLLGREIIKWCSQNGRECVNMATVLPQDLSSVRPPYYWIAEKTLQRKILHFWIRQKQEMA